MDLGDGVPLLHGFLKFGHAPPCLARCVVQRCEGNPCDDPTGSWAFPLGRTWHRAERSICHSDDGVTRDGTTRRGQDVHLGQTEIVVEAALGVGQDDRMSHGICTIFVDPGVQGHDVQVLDLFTCLRVVLVMKFDRIGPSPQKRCPEVTGIPPT